MNYVDVQENWHKYARAIEKIDGDVQALFIDKPATYRELRTLEEKLKMKLPPSLNEVLLNFSKKVEFRWFMPDHCQMEGDLSDISSGERHWSLEWLVQFNEDKNNWRDEVFPNKNDPYDVIWHDKLAFHEVGNGDYLAIDLSQINREPVVYLSHDDGQGHGIELANNFKDFIFASSRLGCVGAEDWQWLPFITKGIPFINPDSENAKMFRKILGVPE